MAFPKEIRMLVHNVSKNKSQPDNIFISKNMTNLIISCTVSKECHINTNHYRIETIINITKTVADQPLVKKWRMIN